MLLGACESDEKKLRRLKTQRAEAYASVQRYQNLVDSIARLQHRPNPLLHDRPLYEDTLMRAQDQFHLADRDLRRFLETK
jgi:hypothetical protein